MAEFAIVLTYKHVFGKSSQVKVIDYLKGIDPEKLLFILGKTNATLLMGVNSLQIFDSYTSSYTRRIYGVEILKIISKLRSNSQNVLFNEKANSHFLKIIAENFDYLNSSKLDDDSEIIEINFFRVYLMINEIIYDSMKEDFLKQIPADHFLEFAQILMMKKTIGDQQGIDVFSDIVKIKSHLNYYFLHEKEILEQFYDLYNIENPDLWIFEIFRILTLADDYENITFTVENHPWIAEYCDGILVNSILGRSTINEVQLKLNSLYKKDDKYYVLNWSHFGQHLFYRIIYQLYELYRRKYNPAMKFEEYKSLMSKKVSEEIVFRKSIEKSFGRNGTFIKYEDETMPIFPDCYLRYNNFVFIFEFKDNALSKEFIEVESYEETKTFIDERFIENKSKRKAKGISQLVKVIECLNVHIDAVDFQLCQNFKKSSIEIFPILVVSDVMFSLPAMESYLTKEFRKIKPIGTTFRKINDLIVINLSYLINYFLNAEKLDFYYLLKTYIRKKKNYKEKGFIPDFPTIEKSTYKEIAKAKQLVEIANELTICDIDLDEQLIRVQEKKMIKNKD